MIIGKIVGFYFLVRTPDDVMIQPNKQPTFTILFCDELTPVFLMSCVFFMLMKQLRNFHNFEYNKNKKAVILFFFFESNLMILIWLSNIFLYNDYKWKAFFLSLGLYPFQQGILVYYFKSSSDPLEGINKLDYLQLCSISQV